MGNTIIQENVCWDNISETMQIPELILCPDNTQVFMYSAITWNRHHIHYNKNAAISEGLPDIVVQRGLIGNFFARLITDWIGERAELRKLSWKVIRSTFPGKKIILRGLIKQKVNTEDIRYINCELTALNENEETIASGDATVVFTLNPTR